MAAFSTYFHNLPMPHPARHANAVSAALRTVAAGPKLWRRRGPHCPHCPQCPQSRNARNVRRARSVCNARNARSTRNARSACNLAPPAMLGSPRPPEGAAAAPRPRRRNGGAAVERGGGRRAVPLPGPRAQPAAAVSARPARLRLRAALRLTIPPSFPAGSASNG